MAGAIAGRSTDTDHIRRHTGTRPKARRTHTVILDTRPGPTALQAPMASRGEGDDDGGADDGGAAGAGLRQVTTNN